MYNFETVIILAKKNLGEKGIPVSRENLIEEARNILDNSVASNNDRIPFSAQAHNPSSFMDPFSLDRTDPDTDRL